MKRNVIENEKETVTMMIGIWCRLKHGSRKGELCRECSELNEYARARLSHCRFGEEKTSCKLCPIHCYKPEMREKIREVMRFVGPRMIIYSPVEAFRHMFGSLGRTKKG